MCYTIWNCFLFSACFFPFLKIILRCLFYQNNKTRDIIKIRISIACIGNKNKELQRVFSFISNNLKYFCDQVWYLKINNRKKKHLSKNSFHMVEKLYMKGQNELNPLWRCEIHACNILQGRT